MIGRLQTDQDKQRLLDGLEGAAGGIKRSEFDRLISDLGKRVFLYHNVHEKKPAVFHTRWAMNYLAGPLTLSQVPDLNMLAGMDSHPIESKVSKNTSSAASKTYSGKRPSSATSELPGAIAQYVSPSTNESKSGNFAPSFVAVAEVRYLRQRPPVDYMHEIAVVFDSPQKAGQDWDAGFGHSIPSQELEDISAKNVKYDPLPDFMKEKSWWSAQEKDFEQWIYETDTVSVRSSKLLGVSAGPEVNDSEFRSNCEKAAQEKIDQALQDLENKCAAKIKTLEDKIERQELKVDKYRNTLNSRRADTALKVGEALLNLASKKKNIWDLFVLFQSADDCWKQKHA